MYTIQPLLQTTAQSLGWALLHSLWQGGLIYCLLLLVNRLTPNASARFKYNTGGAALIGMFLWFADTWIEQWQLLKGAVVVITEPSTGKVIAQTIHINQASAPIIEQWLYKLAPYLENHFSWIVPLYLLCIMLLLVRFSYNLHSVKRLRRQATNPTNTKWHDKIAIWQKEFSLSRGVTLFISEHVNVPMVIGMLKPVIIMPLATINHMADDEMEAILLHELAHIKRNDYFVNLLQVFIETLLFFNPFTWLISSHIRREREYCCDDFVVQHTTHPLPYAKALATLETYRQTTLAMALNGNKQVLLTRIKRILEMKNRNINTTQVLFTSIIALAMIASLLWLTPAIAQSKKEKDEPKDHPTNQTITKKKITIIDDDGTVKSYNSLDEIPESKDKEELKELGLGENNDDEIDEDMNVKMKKIIKTIDIDKTTKEALENIDWDGISKTVSVTIQNATKQMQQSDEAMEAADKAMAEADKALQAIDWKEINKAMAEADKSMKRSGKVMKESDRAMAIADRAMAEADKAMKNIDWEEVNNAYKEGMRIARIETRKAMQEGRVTAANAHKQVSAEAREEALGKRDEALRKREIAMVSRDKKIKERDNYDDMLSKMEDEGIINRAQGFSIKKKGDELYINDMIQPKSIYNKYNNYLKADNISINGNKNKLTISVTDKN